MNYDQYGRCWTTPDELFEMLYQDPKLPLDKFNTKAGKEEGGNTDAVQYNKSVVSTYAGFPTLRLMEDINWDNIEGFDRHCQSIWYMPQEYKDLDIAQYILDQCETSAELQRVGEELLLYADRELLDLLRYLKYFVDTMRKNKVVWGLGRGSSVASYVLYLLGVHKINSMYYDLDIKEFLK